jgi:hypothetical protein
VFLFLALQLFRLTLAQFGACDYYQSLEIGKKYDVFSPKYPSFYSANTACRWTAVAPIGTQIFFSCQDVYMASVIYLMTNPSTTDLF